MRCQLTLAIALALSAQTLHAQDTPAAPGAPTQPPPPTGQISGTVYCADTHRPARGATVLIEPLPAAGGKIPLGAISRTARTGIDGTYSANHLPLGEYGVVAMLPGYLTPLDGFQASDFDEKSPEAERRVLSTNGIAVVTPAGAATLDITLQRGAALSGRVLYSDGSPASQVIIVLEDVNSKSVSYSKSSDIPDIGAFIRTAMTHQNPGTNDHGDFRLAGIKPGTYRIAAVQPAPKDPNSSAFDGMGELFWRLNDPASLHIYSGNTLHKKSALTYTVRPGDEVTGIAITIAPEIFHHVHGAITAKDGRPITAAELKLTDEADNAFLFTGRVFSDGSFIFPTVPSGTYTLFVSDAKIVPDGIEAVPSPDEPFPPTFANTTASLIVKDSDLDDVSITLTENPAPKLMPPAKLPPGLLLPPDTSPQ